MKNLILLIFLFMGLLTKAQTPGSAIFDDSFLHEIHFQNVDTFDWMATKNYQMINVVIDGNPTDSIGFKRKGNISEYPSTHKYGIKVKTNKYVQGKYYDGIKEFTLHMNFQDPTMMREKMTYDICNEMGLFSLRTAFAKVYINNVYWGLYTLVEGKDEMYKHKFGNRSSDAIESLDFGDMCYYGTDVANYDWNDPGATFPPRYELSNGNPLTAWPSFINMLNKANNTPNPQYLDTVSSYFNIEDFFKYQATNVYLMNFDSYISLKGNQIYVFDTLSKKWQVTPWDFNASFGLWETNNYNVTTYPIIPNSISSGCVASKMNSIPQLKNYYLDAMCELNNVICDTTTMNTKITQWKTQIQQAVYTDFRKVFSNSDFDNSLEHGYYDYNTTNFSMQDIPALKTVLSERYNLIKQGLINEGYTCSVGITKNEAIVHSVNAYPNPFQEEVTIEFLLDENSIVDVYVVDILGNRVSIIASKEMNIGINKLHWEARNISKGIYFLNIKTNHSLQSKKLVLN